MRHQKCMRAFSRVLKHSLERSTNNSSYLEEAGKERLDKKHVMKQIVIASFVLLSAKLNSVYTLTEKYASLEIISCFRKKNVIVASFQEPSEAQKEERTVKTLKKHGSLRGVIIGITDENLVMSRIKIGVPRTRNTARTV